MEDGDIEIVAAKSSSARETAVAAAAEACGFLFAMPPPWAVERLFDAGLLRRGDGADPVPAPPPCLTVVAPGATASPAPGPAPGPAPAPPGCPPRPFELSVVVVVVVVHAAPLGFAPSEPALFSRSRSALR